MIAKTTPSTEVQHNFASIFDDAGQNDIRNVIIRRNTPQVIMTYAVERSRHSSTHTPCAVTCTYCVQACCLHPDKGYAIRRMATTFR